MVEVTVCGWDIGGAHLKLVCVDGAGRIVDARQIACPLWHGTEHLQQAMVAAFDQSWARDTRHIVTMTGELCDNFVSRTDGVSKILAVVEGVLGTEHTRIYAGALGLCRLERPPELDPESIASANWQAMAEAVALTNTNAILIDVGSTTTDIIPIVDGVPANLGTDDATRMTHDELIYSGVVRTSLMSICQHVPFAGTWQRVAAEHFANTADIYRILGELPADADLHDTADGGLKTITASARRVCRMLGRDLSEDADAIRNVAGYFAYCQFDQLQRALLAVQDRVGSRLENIVAAGAGAFLVHKLARFNEIPCIEFSSLFEMDPTQQQAVMACAPAAALAILGWNSKSPCSDV